METQERQRSSETQGKALDTDDTGAQTTARRLLMPPSRDVAAKMVGIFRQEIGVLLNKRGWTDEEQKAFRRYKQAIQIVEGAR